MSGEFPSGTVTFLFTDIEGSTRQLQRLGEDYASVLEAQREILRRAFDTFHGREVDTQGDSFFVAFARAGDAIAASVMAQRALAAYGWPEGESVRVRMGLHTGAPQLTPAGYVGLDVHIAARICAAAHGGQVLLSQQTHNLAEQLRLDDVSMRDLGEHRLKDLDQPRHLFQLVISNLRDEFPPLRTLDILPHNLPIQLTSFVGREGEIREIKEILTNDQRRTTNEQQSVRPSSSVIRLLTLTGAGGAGKTRLALQVAADLVEAYANGVWFVELAPLADPALVAGTVAGTLGVREQSGQPILVSLIEYLRARELLLVLDNCEHLIDACARFADALLRACPNLRVLATSREALGIAGETTWLVPSLSLPDAQQPRPTFADLSQYEAVQLFVARAAAVQHGFKLTELNAASVAHICQRLDGIPLAIELAAARVKVLKTAEIAARLDDRFSLLAAGGRTALPRHQTLRAAIDWSYGLLSEPERVLLRRLSVFAGGCTLDAAEQVCGDDERRMTKDENDASDVRHPSLQAKRIIRQDEILELVSHLVDKSLVIVDKQGDETRYRMLETIREYAREKLTEASEAERLRAHHLDYFLRFAEEADPKLRNAEQDEWLQKLEAENENLRAALGWSLTQVPMTQGLRLSNALTWFWLFRNYIREGREWLSRILRSSEAPRVTTERAKALFGLGVLAFEQGDLTIAREALDESIEISRALDDELLLAYATAWRGWIHVHQGNFDSAFALFNESLGLARAAGDKWGAAYSVSLLQLLSAQRLDFGAARAYGEEGIVLFREIGDKWGLTWLLQRLGQFYYTWERDYARAQILLEESLSLARGWKNEKLVADTLWQLGLLAVFQLHFDRAKNLAGEGLTLSRELRYREGIFRAVNVLGEAARVEGDFGRAVTYYYEALELVREMGSKRAIVITAINLGLALLRQNDFPRALRFFDESREHLVTTQDKNLLATFLMAYGAAAIADGQMHEGIRLLAAADAQFTANGTALEPVDQAEYDHYLGIARSQLDELIFNAAWDEGRALILAWTASADMRQVLEYALEKPAMSKHEIPKHTSRQAAKKELNGLTERERQVAARIAQGESNREIAEALVVSERTVETHVTNIFNKLGFTRRAEIRKWAIEKGVLPLAK